MRNIIVIVSCIVILVLVNFNIYSKEKHLNDGQLMLLELRPVDPRSIMQGDYMVLHYRIENDIMSAVKENNPGVEQQNEDGLFVVRLDENNIATFVGLSTAGVDLKENELHLAYRIRNGAIKYATDAFFFEEGQGKTYQSARFAEFRVNQKGELLLLAMRNKDLEQIEVER